MKNVIAIQVSNNQSESPVLFKQSITALVNDGFNVDAITTAAIAEDLQNLKGVNVSVLDNSISKLPVFNFLNTQARLFIKVFKMTNPGDVIYINSIYSIAPALVAKIKKAKLVCHIHHVKPTQNFFERALKNIINKTADQVIFSSASAKDSLGLSVNKQAIVYNTPTTAFINENAMATDITTNKKFTALMISPANAKKSINNYYELAAKSPSVNFELLLTETPDEKMLNFLLTAYRPANLNVSIEKNNKNIFYKKADVLVNLAPENENTATADIKVLEAMYYGLPVIVPTTGGLKELISSGIHGVAIDGVQITEIAKTIHQLKVNTTLYTQLSNACLKQAQLFTPELFAAQFTKLFRGQRANVYDNLIHLFGTAYLNNDQSIFSTAA